MRILAGILVMGIPWEILATPLMGQRRVIEGNQSIAQKALPSIVRRRLIARRPRHTVEAILLALIRLRLPTTVADQLRPTMAVAEEAPRMVVAPRVVDTPVVTANI